MTEPTPVSGNPERFTASNGWYIDELGNLHRPNDSGYIYAAGSSAFLIAAVEYGRHLERTERDKELGRERVEGYPDYAVYPRADSVGCRVIDERADGREYLFSVRPEPANDEHCGPPQVGTRRRPADRDARRVARAWFDAQEPPKPWLSAKPGEAWALTIDGTEKPYIFSGGKFYSTLGNSIYPHDATAGRRIWPEPEEADRE